MYGVNFVESLTLKTFFQEFDNDNFFTLYSYAYNDNNIIVNNKLYFYWKICNNQLPDVIFDWTINKN